MKSQVQSTADPNNFKTRLKARTKLNAYKGTGTKEVNE